MSYVIKEVEGKKGIYETDSKVFIEFKKKKDKEIQTMARKMNLGAGFNGWTPQFFADNTMYK